MSIKFNIVLLFITAIIIPAMAQHPLDKNNYRKHEEGIIKESDLLNGKRRDIQKPRDENNYLIALPAVPNLKEEVDEETDPPEVETEPFSQRDEPLEADPGDEPEGAPEPPDPPDLPIDGEVGLLFAAMLGFGLKVLYKRG